jgi:hypothetical protein
VKRLWKTTMPSARIAMQIWRFCEQPWEFV